MGKGLSEDAEQALLVEWLHLIRIAFFAIPNGGYRTGREAAKFKRTGVKSGVPDIFIPLPCQPTGSESKCYHGLFLELKRASGGIVSENQKRWIKYLNNRGYLAIVCHGFEEAKKVVEKYLADC